jgi:hypothetical protein
MVAPTASEVGTEMEATSIIFGISGDVHDAFACGMKNADIPSTNNKKLCLTICIIFRLSQCITDMVRQR